MISAWQSIFSYRIVNFWNSPSEPVVSALSLNYVKNRFDKHRTALKSPLHSAKLFSVGLDQSTGLRFTYD